MYWTDAREQHGTGRRAIQPVDHLRNGLGQPVLDGSKPAPRREAAHARRAADLGRIGQEPYDGAEHRGDRTPQREVEAVVETPIESCSVVQEDRDFCDETFQERRQLFGDESLVDARDASKASSSQAPSRGQPAPRDMFDRSPEPQSNRSIDSARDYDPAGRGGARPPVNSRRCVGAEASMLDVGTSAPSPDRYGRGRRFFQPEDHQPTRADHQARIPSSDQSQSGHGRKAFVIGDHVREEVLRPVEELAPQEPPSSDAMKEALKEWLLEMHGMLVFDENRWEEAILKQHGLNWTFQAVTETGKSIHREAQTARALAEKFAMMPTPELRAFGLRFAGKNEIPQRSARREKKLSMEDNPSLASPGIQVAMGSDAPRVQGSPHLSTARKHPNEKMRRYISSGQDHFESSQANECDAPGTHGNLKDYGFSDGLPRGIGHGKRYIGTKDLLFGGNLAADRGR
mmetsp:Transcript_75155/g.220290  ORF Transcript_75155/g.220290 Transcript_75155/m.220290 type:complete len:458 (+) Transcript_75155:81-1454(+)